MFWSSFTRLRDWLEIAEDFLGDPPEQAPAPIPQSHVAAHPHRRALRWERERRPGMVAPRPAHCLSPVRGERAGGRTDQALL